LSDPTTHHVEDASVVVDAKKCSGFGEIKVCLDVESEHVIREGPSVEIFVTHDSFRQRNSWYSWGVQD